MEKYYESDAIILRGVSYGEGHRIFTVYGREEGKFSAVARGILKQKSKLKGHLQLGNRCTLQLTRGRGMDTVTGAVATETYAANREKSSLYFYASYFLELLNDFAPEQMPDADLFGLLDAVLKQLAVEEPPRLARFYELKLLSLAGFAPNFDACAACGAPIKTGYLTSRFTGVLCEKCGGGLAVPPKALFALKYLSETDLTRLSRLKTDKTTDEVLAVATKLMLERSLGKKVRSRKLLDDFDKK